MNKNIGFRRNIYLSWLDAAAAICVEERDPAQVRARLDPIVAQQIASKENRRMALDILLNIWVGTEKAHPHLRATALEWYANPQATSDRLWLHYGLTLLAYDFFRLCTGTIGRMSQYGGAIVPKDVKKRIFAEMGQLGALEKATERVIFSLRNWGLLVDAGRRSTYKPIPEQLKASGINIECWLIAAALTASPAEEIPFADLVRLPELFPFTFILGVDDLRRSQWFEVKRQGSGWDMVRLAKTAQELPRPKKTQPRRERGLAASRS